MPALRAPDALEAGRGAGAGPFAGRSGQVDGTSRSIVKDRTRARDRAPGATPDGSRGASAVTLSRSMVAILGGLGAAMSWAIATLASSRSSRMIGPMSVLGWVMAVGLGRGDRPGAARAPDRPRPARGRRARRRRPVAQRRPAARLRRAVDRPGLDRRPDRRHRGRARGRALDRPRRAARARDRRSSSRRSPSASSSPRPSARPTGPTPPAADPAQTRRAAVLAIAAALTLLGRARAGRPARARRACRRPG